MKQITEISNDALQRLVPQLEDNDSFILNISYSAQNLGWYFGIEYGNRVLPKNRRLTMHPNLLRPYKNIIPFGLACMPTNWDLSTAKEIFFIDDFTSGTNGLYILTQEEVDYFEDTIFNAGYNG